MSALVVPIKLVANKWFMIALWAFMRAHPDADFSDFEAAAERAARMTGDGS